MLKHIGDTAMKTQSLHRPLVPAILLWLWLSFTSPPQLVAQETQLDLLTSIPQIHENLPGAMAIIAQTYRTPMLVVTRDDHAALAVDAGKMALRQVLDLAVRQNPGYSWKERNGVILFQQIELSHDPRFFLNWKLATFTIFGDVAEVQSSLAAHIQKLRYHIESKGGVTTGIRDAQLVKHRLTTITLQDSTVSEIVLRTLQMDHSFYSIIEFPSRNPLRDTDLDAAFVSWKWMPFY